MSNYNKYLTLKSYLNGINYKGYPLNKVLGSYLAELSWKYSAKKIRRYAQIKVRGQIKLKSHPNILTYTVERNDYKHLMKGYFPNLQPQSVKLTRNKMDALLYLPQNIVYLHRAKKFVSHIECTLKEKAILISCISLGLKIIDEIERHDFECEEYYAFNSSFQLESFLAYYFRKKGTPTYSLQHGMYFNFLDNIPMDVINYENCCANELLLWGEFSKQQVAHQLPNDVKTKIVGHPFINRQKIPSQENSNNLYVLLPRYQYWNDSITLLDILKKASEDRLVIVRPHPKVRNKLKDYIKVYPNIKLDEYESSSEQMSNIKFKAVIAFNSTMVFEALALNQNVLYFNQNSEMDTSGFTTFSTQDELLNWLKSNQKNNQNASYYYANDGKLTTII